MTAKNKTVRIGGASGFWGDSSGVPDVSLVLQGDRLYAGTSNATGAYTVSGAAAGDYTLTPTKADDTDGISHIAVPPRAGWLVP